MCVSLSLCMSAVGAAASVAGLTVEGLVIESPNSHPPTRNFVCLVFILHFPHNL